MTGIRNFLLVLMLPPLVSFSQDEQLRTDWANLKKYAAENAILMSQPATENRIVFLGNSITESWKSIDSGFFLHAGYINRGISGQTTSQLLVRFRQDVLALKPSVVVILAGINDIAENTGPIPLSDVFGNIVSMAELARVNGIRVVLCSVLPAHEFPWHAGLQPAEKVIRLNAMIQGYCRENNIVYVNYYGAMVDERKGLDSRFTRDGVHPTLEGYKIMEPLVVKGIAEATDKE